MREIIRIFEEIKNTSSINEKKEIIKKNKDNELFKKCLMFLLDNDIQTGLSEKKINKKVRIMDYCIPNFSELMDYLIVHNTGTDEDISIVKTFINNRAEEFHDFYIGFVTKSYKIGCDAKVVNDAIPGLIKTFDVMLGTPIDKCKLKGTEWISLSHKLNGTRCAFVGNKCMTRQGKEYKGLDHIVNELISLGYQNYFIDGELLYKNEEGLTDSEAFQKGTGIAMSKNENKEELKLVVFDIFPLEEFWNGKSKYNYMTRSQLYLDEFKNSIVKSKNLDVVETVYQGYNHYEIWKWLDYAEENDWEGIMINLNEPYECKRTKTLIKVKKFFSCDILCTDIEEGSGKNKGTLGAIVCYYKENEVRVGSGFTDEQRKYYWENPEKIVGNIVSIKYKEETKNKDGGISIQFPVFECVRFDKDTISYM